MFWCPVDRLKKWVETLGNMQQEGLASVLLLHPASLFRASVLPCVEAPMSESTVLCVCVCVCVTPILFSQINSFAIIQHLSIAMFALQQCLDSPPAEPFHPLSTDSKAMYRECIPTAPCIPHMNAPLPG